MTPVVSIIMPYRDADQYIHLALSSIISQTFPNFEVLCVDNGSTDNGAVVVRGFANNDERIRQLVFPHPGKSLALNYGISHARGKWLAICDADDTWDLEKLEKQVSLADRFPEYDVLGTQMRYVNEAGLEFKEAPLLPIRHNEICESIFKHQENPICNSSVMYKKAVHGDHVGFYDPLCAVEDYDLWARCVFAGLRFINSQEVLVSHRLHDNSSFNSSQKQAMHKNLVDAKNNALNQINISLEDNAHTL
jgi:glycosyltransferase involved in cell wall biosynthesis